jgi:hypothetical protein
LCQAHDSGCSFCNHFVSGLSRAHHPRHAASRLVQREPLSTFIEPPGFASDDADGRLEIIDRAQRMASSRAASLGVA